MPPFKVHMFLLTPRNEELGCCNSADQIAFSKNAFSTQKIINYSYIPMPWKLERLALPK